MTDTAPRTGLRPLPVEAVLLDAGGVLLDLDYDYLRRLIEARHRDVSVVELSREEARARAEVERLVREGGSVGEAWREYFGFILHGVHVPAARHEAIIDSLWEAHHRIGLWTTPCPGALETVAELKRRGFRLGVVSNAEGRVAQDLDGAGYRGMFETVVDSCLVGVQKPDPAIFRIALERMGLRADRTVYLGDLPAVDVAGSRAAGLSPVLLDPHDLYPGADAPRLRSIQELPDLIDLVAV